MPTQNETPQASGQPIEIKPSVVIVDDHALVREALITTLELSGAYDVIGDAATGSDGIDVITAKCPSLALVDFSLPDMTGADLITRARAAGSTSRFLLLTGAPLNSEERDELSRLADGFHHKESGRTSLLEAITKCLDGPVRTPRRSWDDDDPHTLLKAGSLTARERDVVREIARGRSIDEIADSFGISVGTVRKHRENIMSKLGVTSSTQLVRAALQIGQY